MCEFRPGDEVVCVRMGRAANDPTRVGDSYVVERVWMHPVGSPALDLVGVFNSSSDGLSGFWGHNPLRFRKVQKRNDRLTIEAFMKVPGGFEDPKRTPAPAKKRERV